MYFKVSLSRLLFQEQKWCENFNNERKNCELELTNPPSRAPVKLCNLFLVFFFLSTKHVICRLHVGIKTH